jgi:hypothetical protein
MLTLRRLYTVTVTTSAALLVAAIVWAPAIQPGAIHDNAFGDIIIIPRKGFNSITALYNNNNNNNASGPPPNPVTP